MYRLNLLLLAFAGLVLLGALFLLIPAEPTPDTEPGLSPREDGPLRPDRPEEAPLEASPQRKALEVVEALKVDPSTGVSVLLAVLEPRTRRPLEGVEVVLNSPFQVTEAQKPPRTLRTRRVTTDLKGEARFELHSPGPHTYRVDSEWGYAEGDLPSFRGTGPHIFAIELTERKSGYLRLVDRDTGTPLQGVHLYEWNGSEIPSNKLGETDGYGDVRIPLPRKDKEVVHPRKVGYGPLAIRVDSRGGDPRHPMIVEMIRATRFEITVLDSSGHPSMGVDVEVRAPRHLLARPEGQPFLAEDYSVTATTDAYGRCELRGLPAEVPMECEVSRAREILLTLPERLLGSPGETVQRTLRLGVGATVVGTLRDEKALPLRGRQLALVPREDSLDEMLFSEHDVPLHQTTTDDTGRFRFEDIPSGPWWIGPVHPAHASTQFVEFELAPLARSITIDDDADRLDVSLIGRKGYFLDGVVLDTQGAPASEVFVIAALVEGRGFASGRVGDDGTFSLGPFHATEVSLQVPAFGGVHSGSEKKIVQADRGPFTLELMVGGDLEVTALADGSPHKASLSLSGYDFEGTPTVLLQTAIDPEDRLITNLRPGLYDLFAYDDEGRVAIQDEVRIDAQNLTKVRMTLASGSRLRIRYNGPEVWGQLNIVHEGHNLVQDGLQSGTSVIHTVLPGKLTVFLRMGKETLEREVRVAIGETAEVTFDVDDR